jgi:hypothetical protein
MSTTLSIISRQTSIGDSIVLRARSTTTLRKILKSLPTAEASPGHQSKSSGRELSLKNSSFTVRTRLISVNSAYGSRKLLLKLKARKKALTKKPPSVLVPKSTFALATTMRRRARLTRILQSLNTTLHISCRPMSSKNSRRSQQRLSLPRHSTSPMLSAWSSLKRS